MHGNEFKIRSHEPIVKEIKKVGCLVEFGVLIFALQNEKIPWVNSGYGKGIDIRGQSSASINLGTTGQNTLGAKLCISRLAIPIVASSKGNHRKFSGAASGS